MTNGVTQGRILSPMLFNFYMDELSKRLCGTRTGYMIERKSLICTSPYSAGLQELLLVCSDYGEQFDVNFNARKSVIMIVKMKDDQKRTFRSFFLADRELNVVNRVKYLGHFIKDNLCDDNDIQRQYCKLYAQAVDT